MTQMGFFSDFSDMPLTVSQLTARIKALLESDVALADVWVEGEVSNFSRPASGHLYFSLKDATARIQCVMWRSTAARLRFLPENGQAVRVHGRLSVYETQGAYQLYAEEILPAGLGDYYVQLERLKGCRGAVRRRAQALAAGVPPPHRHRDLAHGRGAARHPARAPAAFPLRGRDTCPHAGAGRRRSPADCGRD